MTSIYFVRHAQPDYKFKNTSDRPLTNEGLQDRLKAADVLEKIDISAIYSSPYKRAYDTVLPLAERLGLALTRASSIMIASHSVWPTQAALPVILESKRW